MSSYEPMDAPALPPKSTNEVSFPNPVYPAEGTAPEEKQEVLDADDDGINDKTPGDVPQKYLNLEFEACFHEHEKSMLVKPVHKCMGLTYKWIKLIVYHAFAIVIGVPMLIVWAIINGIMAFTYSWLWSPVLRLVIFWLAATMPIITMPLVAIYRPLVDVGARCFRQIRVKAFLDKSGKTHIV